MINIPNIFFDKVMPNLSHEEFKVMMIVLAEEDIKKSRYVKIPNSLFTKKTGLSSSVVEETVKSLEEKKLLYVMRIKPVYGYSSTLDLYVKEG